jgi:sterol 14-demethylase
VVYDATKKNRQVQFQTMANGLRTNRLKSYVTKIEEETRAYLKHEWGASGQVDILTSLSELTILTASRCLHGDDVREHIFKDVQELYHDLDHGLTPLTVFWPNAPTAAHKKRNAAPSK